MTSTTGGDAGQSFGWINRELIASGEIQPHMNAFGGEDRFWMGPEGGQFSIFFAKGKKFEFADWQTPAIFDTEPFKVVSKADDKAVFGAEFSLTNYSGTVFNVSVEREVRLLSPDSAWKNLGVKAAKDVSRRGLRLGQQDHQRGQGSVEEGNRTALGLDSGHVQSVAVHHDRRAHQSRTGSGTGRRR